ncbi:MAG: 2-polyprenyl-3-methyl-6-methoxy-1,4-benzoquinone monooxygenase [Formivibrio sp.]|nr:2-polyprenyl-3-methyl-6-methoxy-1,4-benzoquinone monooxygenase [Formivibrio sp.]
MPRLPRLDELIAGFDVALRTLAATPVSERPHPDARTPDVELTEAQKQHAAGLMRVNHCGEVCAQALYQGQALTARDPATSAALHQAAKEEVEHLAWTERRIHELGGRKSLLNPLWYAGSLAMGVTAGLVGDKWNLGFLVETEHQVGAHLQSHLQRLPVEDTRSRAIVEQMYRDEISHAAKAESLGAATLPKPVPLLMSAVSKVMTTLSYRL